MANGSRQSRSPIRAITSVDHSGALRHPYRSDRTPVAPGGHAAAPALAPATGAQGLSCPRCGSALQRQLIRRALEENGEVMTRAAKALGLKYTTFVAMAHRLGVVEKDKNGDDGS